MSQAVAPFPHPLVGCVAEVGAALDRVAGADPIYLTTDAKEAVLAGLTRQIARLEGLRLSVLAAAGDVAEGQHIERGRVVGHVAGNEVRSPFHGTVKGLLAVAGERLTRSQPIAWLRTA